MATIRIEGVGSINVDDRFRDLPKADQDRAVAEIANSLTSFNSRFAAAAGGTPQNAPALRAGLESTARAMTTGPATSPSQNMAIEHGNIQSAASQRTAPRTEGRQLISNEVFESDDGTVRFRDPQSGQTIPTDQSKHIVLRDPADNTPKVYARTAETNEGPAVGAARVLAPGLASGAPTARAAIGAAEGIVPKASDIMATSKPFYRAFKNEAGQIEIPQETASGIADRLRAALMRVNLSDEMAGAPARSAIAMLSSDEPMTLDLLQRMKRMAGRGFSSAEKDSRDAASVLSGEITKIISEVSPEAARNLKTGDAIHSTAMGVQDLQRKADVADLRAGRAGYGGNAVNNMRQVLSPIVQRAVEGKQTGFKPDEIEAMRQIVEGTPATNVLRGIGQFSPTKGIMASGLALAATGGGMAAGMGPGALAIPVIGAASNKLATILTGKQIERLQELVAKRSPAYAEAVARATQKYEAAQEAFVSDPSPSRLAGLLSASRGLSSGLTRDGMSVSSGDLLRSLQGPVRAPAEDEQQ